MSTVSDSVHERLRAAAGVFEREPVVFAYLFGSVATGRARADSDVDVAVYVDKATPPDAYLDLSLRLAGALSDASDVGDIEVLVLNDAPLDLQGRAVTERLLLYSRDEPFRVRYEGLTLRQYWDWRFHADVLDKELLRKIAEGSR
jgi:hypothetical protein